ncbi:unnamed protein product [Owenia fusiformis]|uniref:phosphatidate phosphatase n=1 Tax=Owenia fusiformis TaxID=6347 RepID=A0A8J1UDI1_OWEFU|nr:unnamed protein product [Owenia fusiformis]
MNYFGKLVSNFKGFYNEINSATLTGAIDVIVVQQEDGSFLCSPFHVRFGKLGVLRSREKIVDIEVNGEPVPLHMKLGEAGEAFFVAKVSAEELSEGPEYLATSPIPTAEELIREGLKELKKQQDGEETAKREKDNAGIKPEIDSEITLEGRKQRQDSEMSLESNETDRRSRLDSEISLRSQTDSERSVEFRPITQADSSTSQTDTSTTSLVSKPTKLPAPESSTNITKKTTSSSSANSESINIENEKDSNIGKRRRRKKHRKNNNKSQIAKNDSKEDDFEDQEIFDLDVEGVDEEVAAISLPSLEENRNERTDDWANSHYASHFHPFSDGDITPVMSPIASRPPSPKSDTEYEKQMLDSMSQTEVEDGVTWNWGELPEPHKAKVKVIESPAKDEEKAKTTGLDILPTPDEEKPTGGLFHFMRKTKKMRHQPEQEGIYLDDLSLDQMDPEIAALYLYNTKSSSNMRTIQDEDNESGRGASLPHSPLSIEGAEKFGHRHEDFPLPSGSMPEVYMSLCGGLDEYEGDIPLEKFHQDIITFEEFKNKPNIFNNSKLVIKIADKYYNWQIAAPVLMSVLVFQKPLTEEVVNDLIKEHMPKKPERRRGWFSGWGRGGENPKQSRDPLAAEKKDDVTSLASSAPSSPPDTPQKQKRSKAKPETKDESTSTNSSDDESDTSDRSERGTSVPSDTTKLEESTSRLKVPHKYHHHESFKKSVRLTSEQLGALNLKEGPNEVTYSVTTQYQGTSRCTSYIYLWNYNDKIIVSDIDGTITKSDVLGQVLPMIGKDWSQIGVTSLYTSVQNNGYRFMYLSARAIGQSKITRDYLKSIRQGELALPDGPMFLSPSSLVTAFQKEVIEKKPEEFKIACLRDIATLFPSNRNPFYAGYGNKVNDVWTYLAVGIPRTHIFTINHRGEVKHELSQTFQTSYTGLNDVVDHFFPPVHDTVDGPEPGQHFHAPKEYSTFTYWREPLPDIEIDLDVLKKDSKAKEEKK